MLVKHVYQAKHMKARGRNTASDQLLTVRGIIRAARGARTQEVYAAELGIRQDLLCKYEKGRANPPSLIVERCMRDVHRVSEHKTPSAETIARRVRADLVAPELEPVRAIIANLLDVLSAKHRSRHSP